MSKLQYKTNWIIYVSSNYFHDYLPLLAICIQRAQTNHKKVGLYHRGGFTDGKTKTEIRADASSEWPRGEQDLPWHKLHNAFLAALGCWTKVVNASKPALLCIPPHSLWASPWGCAGCCGDVSSSGGLGARHASCRADSRTAAPLLALECRCKSCVAPPVCFDS